MNTTDLIIVKVLRDTDNSKLLVETTNTTAGLQTDQIKINMNKTINLWNLICLTTTTTADTNKDSQTEEVVQALHQSLIQVAHEIWIGLYIENPLLMNVIVFTTNPIQRKTTT
jgi:hypothetical protein